jgi:23S rRNA (adenine2503-C2)-methyltransferase
MASTPDIRSLDLAQLKTWFEEQGEKAFRAKQVHEWLWKRNVAGFEDMSNLSKPLREKLAQHFVLEKASIVNEQRSSDGTIKYGFRLAGGHMVEGVLIPTSSRVTACISSQAGCSLTCKFCATGYLDLKHNLRHYEIVDQIATLKDLAEKEYGRPLTNIVYMGMGEPLLNYRNVLASIERVTAEDGLGMSPRRITVSTAGIAKMIRKLGDDEVKFEFAVSLHAANDQKRSEIMPINEHNSLEALGDALKHFYEKTGTRVTYEYIIFKDFNDTLEDARELLEFSRVIPSKINIIEYNPIGLSGLQNTTTERMNRFRDWLESQGAIVNIRRSRGRDVDGACGQLALKNQPMLHD